MSPQTPLPWKRHGRTGVLSNFVSCIVNRSQKPSFQVNRLPAGPWHSGGPAPEDSQNTPAKPLPPDRVSLMELKPRWTCDHMRTT